MTPRSLRLLGFLALATAAPAAISVSGVSNRSRYTNTVTFTVTGATSVLLDGEAVAIGSPVTVTAIGYHELVSSDGATTDVRRFLVRNSERSSTEDGIPTMRPLRFVNDAPSAFADGVLTVMAPAVFPKNLPVPVAARLTKGAAFGAAAGDPLFLNGVVTSGTFPSSPVQLRRGWGSTILPAQTAEGTTDFSPALHGLTDAVPMTIEPTTTWTTAGGTLTTAENWPANSRIHLTSTLALAPGASLTVGAGTVVRCAPGVEVWIRPGASVNISGTVESPVTFVPDDTSALWGGFWLQPQSGANVATLTATGTLFCCWGANQNWFATAPAGEPSKGFPHHRNMQPLAASAAGAVVTLTDCALIGPTGLAQTRGAAFAANGGSLLLTRVLVQRCITGGEQEDCPQLEIHSSAFLEMTEPGVDVDSDAFADADNDGLYLVPDGRTYNLSKTVVGWTKDDGVDTGADGSGTVNFTQCWFENCIHEAISNSGVNRRPQSFGSVHFNSGQGMECGYGGPLSILDHCLLIANMVGARYGDNYGGNSGSNGSGTSQYNGNITLRNGTLALHNGFRDVWGMDFSYWDPALGATRVIMTDSKVTRAADLALQNGPEDSGNSLWNPTTDAPLLAPFMPVPGSAVGIDFLLPTRQASLLDYPGTFTVRLSTFSSNAVSATWRVVGKTSSDAPAETELATGSLLFEPGETVKTFSATLPANHGFPFVAVALSALQHAEITGAPAFYYFTPTPPAPQVLFDKGATGWSYQALRAAPANDAQGRTWKQSDYTETNWQQNKPAPIGFGSIDTNANYAATVLTTAEQGPAGDRTKAVYFRKAFTVADPTAVAGLTLDVVRDDGVVFYLNGTEILRNNIDSGTSVGGTISYSTLATSGITGAAEAANNTFTVPAAFTSLLVAGTNVLAAEVHQDDVSSSDLILDVKLTATFHPPGGTLFQIASMGDERYLFWTDAVHPLQTSDDLQGWTTRPDLHSPLPLETTAERKFYRLGP